MIQNGLMDSDLAYIRDEAIEMIYLLCDRKTFILWFKTFIFLFVD